MLASSLRGTVASSRMVVGATRARAEKALRRAVASLSASASSLAPRALPAAFFAADLFHARGFVGHGGGMAVGFHQQQRLAIQRQADFGVVLDAMNGGAVQELQRAGNDLRGDDGRDGLSRAGPFARRSRASFFWRPAWESI